MNCIASSIPGRIRLRHISLRDPSLLSRLSETLSRWPQVRAVTPNPRTGSLLVAYDADGLGAEECTRRCEAAVAGLLPRERETARESALRSPAGRPARRGGTPRVRANRLAKRGMLASLAASLLLAAAGAKRGHIWTGLFFLHALGVHLWAHRRNLIR